MRLLVPIFMGLLNTVVSKTQPIDVAYPSNIDATETWDSRDKIFFPFATVDGDPDDFAPLKAVAGLHRRVNDDDDEREQPRNSNDEESRFEPDALTATKIFDRDDNVGDPLYDLDAASPSMDELDENDLSGLAVFLTKLLRQSVWKAPLVIIEEPTIAQETYDVNGKMSDVPEGRPPMGKRSRYYRRYPWKRQNSRSRHNYDYDAAHFCQPSREDVYQLLVALHNVRQGNKRRLVNFCKRHRSAGTVFTNIRFLGRRK